MITTLAAAAWRAHPECIHAEPADPALEGARQMSGSVDLTSSLAAFARTLARSIDLELMLRTLTGHVTDVLGIRGAGVVVVGDDGVTTVVSADDGLAELERAQADSRRGPSFDAMRWGRPVVTRDVQVRSRHWPSYCRTADQVGVRSVASLPLRSSHTFGSVDLFDGVPRLWSPAELAVGGAFADLAWAHLGNEVNALRQRRTAEQLQHALQSRVVIEQAKGIIAASHHVGMDEAFAILRRFATDHRTPLRSVAEAVVRLELRP